MLKSRGFWAIAVPRFLSEPAWQTFNFFIPLYLVAVWKLDLKSIALWAWLPFLAADFGSLAAGLLPPWLGRDDVHRAYRSALVRKMPEHYGPLFPDVEEDLPYVWPV